MLLRFRKEKDILQNSCGLFTFSAAGCRLFLNAAKKEKSHRSCRESSNVIDKSVTDMSVRFVCYQLH